MKTKISRIMGVGLALLMVFSLALALMPAKEAKAIEGEVRWGLQPLPTITYFKLALTSNVLEYAIASNGTTIYLITDNAVLNAAAGPVYKSLDGGTTWAQLPGIGTAAADLATNIAVAPDNPDAIAVSCGSNNSLTGVDQVWVSNNGGTTWSALPAPLLQTGTIEMRILDLKVAPARVGTLLPREYLIATSDNRDQNATLGTLQIIGQGSAWTQVADAPYPAGTMDFVACEFSPGYAGDRVVVAVSDNTDIGARLFTLNTATPAVQHAPVQLSAAITDYTDNAIATANILNADLALPIDYDVTVPGFERVFVGTASTTAANDNVWRCDSVLPAQQLGLGGTSVRSLAYSGTGTAGTLFEGNWTQAGGVSVITQVNWTNQMTTNLPVWYPSRKPPTGNGGRAYVRTSPTFDADMKVFVGTTGNGAGSESALSLSTDAGDTYNQIAFIDNGAANDVVAVDALSLTPDGGTLFVATRAGTNFNVWKTATAPAPFTWTRIYCAPSANAMVLAINVGGWADAPEIYLANSGIAASGLFASYDGGKIFTNKHLPQAGVAFMSVATSKTLYAAVTTNVYKSINGGQQWGPPINANVGAIATVLPAPNGDILVGGTGLASISKDGGASFAQLQPGLPGAAVGVMADEGYAENNIVYAFDFATAAANDIYRVNVATDAIWVAIGNPTVGPIVGFGQSSGVLYSMTAGIADRTLTPRGTVGTIGWDTMGAGTVPGAVAACFSVAANKLYASNGVIQLVAYNDQMATAKAAITSPASGTMVPVDPVSGRGVTTTLAWSPLGSGQGLCTAYDILIYDTAAGPTAGTLFAAVAIAPPFRTAPKVDINLPGAAGGTLGAFVLRGGTEYGVWVRGSIQLSTDNLASQWSDAGTFRVEASGGVVQPPHAGPLLTSPTPGDQNVDPGAAFSWAPMSGVTEYELIIATDAALTKPVAGTPVTLNTTAYGPVTLEYDTDYYYAVTATAPTSSVQSIGAFHTMISPEEAVPPVVVAPEVVSPAWIWAVVIIGALLVIAVLVLIVRTRRA
jgi:hypothetical protein